MALYRKYRPASFAEVVGQEQVTRPLSVALDTGHINHAYLFSGPRGCGKTSSARILARSLNCVEGPTSTPCGHCPSCVSLAPGGSGNLDVTELDAASHNGVEDMRALRDRAYYAPAESRYRVFIIDEAHMISSAGANALLKIVEEPPEHTIFIFATTEPEKMIGTIRSRVHHYPFRLLTPQSMRQLLHHVVEEEQVNVEESVYSLVVNAGGGSPRDSLSILDQLLSGAGPEGLTYEMALPLLGVTDLSLIDDSIAALAANDAAAAFQLIDRVIEAGHDPRRYVQDLLDRLRDLMILQVVPTAFEQGLVDAPPARQEVMREEAALFPHGRLAELADRVNERITELRGATAPRLLLEILMAHLIVVPSAVGQSVPPSRVPQPAAPLQQPQHHPEAAPQQVVKPPEQAAVFSQPEKPRPPEMHQAAKPSSPQLEHAEQQAVQSRPQPAPPSSQNNDLLVQVQRQWGAICSAIGEQNTVISVMLTQARPVAVEGDTLIISHTTGALARRLSAESKAQVVRAVIAQKTGHELAVRFVTGGFTPQTTRQPQQEAQPHEAQPTPTQETLQRDQPDKTVTPAEPPQEDQAAQPGQPPGTQQPAQAEAPQKQRVPGWRQLTEESKRKQAEPENVPVFSNGVPVPPEPDDGYGEWSENSGVAEGYPGVPEEHSGKPVEPAQDSVELTPKPVRNASASQMTPQRPAEAQETNLESSEKSLEAAIKLVQRELGGEPV